ncbi:hypothetical protein WN48_06722 [Eufriesea mexicana]|uniref:Uncharacterized protein n=2 Tax=Eufriesea mexicana TaxID=516756 RepID=A0A310S8J8_9HYME|nr:hypothetical protein WN48_06722 [Eufriesea mexicana]
MEEFLQEVKKDYETLKEQCDHLNNVFEEHGYHYSEDDILNETSINNNKGSAENLVEEMGNLEIEFTPNLSWKCKIRQNELTSISSNSCISHTFTTPSTSSLTIPNDSSIIHKDYICTPGRERPQEPIYSKHFYSILKK